MNFRGYTSIIQRKSHILIRKVLKYEYRWMVKREAKFLEILSKYDAYPKLINVGSNYLDISFCGEHSDRLKQYTDQKNRIIEPLLIEGIIWRDISPRNILVMDNSITLIDAGWAIFKTEKDTPKPAPKQLGGKYYPNKQNGIWNDSQAWDIMMSEAI